MTALIFFWYLVTTPADRIVCTLWIRETPGPAALISSCGTDSFVKYRLDVLALGGQTVICSRPGEALLWVADDCKLPQSLDHYIIRVIQPEFTEVVCPMSIEHYGLPNADEISAQCGAALLGRFRIGTVQAKFVGSHPKAAETKPAVCAAAPLAVGFGIYDQAPDVQSLRTDLPLTWLAGRLIWFGVVRPQCEGGRSGIDPETLAADTCGLAAARSEITRWQNQFDGDLYNAATRYQVPARLLKRMIAIESQYWPLWSDAAGETGMLQVSQNGADVILRYDADLDPAYPTRTTHQQYWKRLEILNGLACMNCSLDQAVWHMHETIPMYARLLAAYRCRAVEMNPAISGAEAWQQAAIDYNGATEYLSKVEQQ